MRRLGEGWAWTRHSPGSWGISCTGPFKIFPLCDAGCWYWTAGWLGRGSNTSPSQTFVLTFFNPCPRICLLILKGRQREKHDVRKKHQWVSSVCTLTGNQTCNLGIYPDQGLNPQQFGVWDDTPTNWATLPGQLYILLKVKGGSKCTLNCTHSCPQRG